MGSLSKAHSQILHLAVNKRERVKTASIQTWPNRGWRGSPWCETCLSGAWHFHLSRLAFLSKSCKVTGSPLWGHTGKASRGEISLFSLKGDPLPLPSAKAPFGGGQLTGGFVRTVDVLQVTLELERRGELSVAVLADGVDVHLPVLLVQFNVVLHVVHEPAGKEMGGLVWLAMGGGAASGCDSKSSPKTQVPVLSLWSLEVHSPHPQRKS